MRFFIPSFRRLQQKITIPGCWDSWDSQSLPAHLSKFNMKHHLPFLPWPWKWKMGPSNSSYLSKIAIFHFMIMGERVISPEKNPAHKAPIPGTSKLEKKTQERCGFCWFFDIHLPEKSQEWFRPYFGSQNSKGNFIVFQSHYFSGAIW